ncbi:hypothetical protein C8A00DRAFT_18617 [Chaetomidium leptoderma]|uniref:Aminoglycoside phosphotransferase domain-containing protein n=1 Tax=Chaetomidium leptoderma TaxID=669021 RepID=A0AAN6VEB1_9PEZI|nr:hypothetical protein C8A00DRAFT_18617 [Chaetomidium leptoderma]
MSSQPTATVPFTIMTVRAGSRAFDDSPDMYRIRIKPEHAGDGPTTKYLVAPHTSKTLTGPDARIRRHNLIGFDTVPAGDWVVAHLAVTADSKLEIASLSEPTPASLEAIDLRSASPVWHPVTIPNAACQLPGSYESTTITTPSGATISVPKPPALQCMDYPDAAVFPAPPGLTAAADTTATVPSSVVCITQWMPGHDVSVGADSRAYERIAARDPGLAPRFLGHVAENGPESRVVGYLVEHLAGVREAGPADLEACRAALGRLHALGLAKGPLRRHSFLVREDGGVLIQGPFVGEGPAWGGEDAVADRMAAAMESLEAVLATSPSEYEDQEARLLRLVDPERTRALDAFEEAHGLIVPFVYWQESREGGGRITLTLEQHGVLAKEYEENGFRWTKDLQEEAERRFGPSAEGVDE